MPPQLKGRALMPMNGGFSEATYRRAKKDLLDSNVIVSSGNGASTTFKLKVIMA